MLWIKLYELCKKQKDIELSFIAATSISDEIKREAALGGLIEDLIINDILNSLFNCRLSNKNLQITTDYLKKKLSETLEKVTRFREDQEKSEYFKSDLVYLKLLSSFHSINLFYTRPRESCQYLLSTLFCLQDYKHKSHIHISNILQIEREVLSHILSVSRTFDNPSKYIFYIRENDYYSHMKRRDMDMDEEEISISMVERFFDTQGKDEGYIVTIAHLEKYQVRNQAQLGIYEKCREFIDDDQELIEFCIYFNWFDLAIKLCKAIKSDPVPIIQQMAYQYCVKFNESDDENGSENGIYEGEKFAFEDDKYGWNVSELQKNKTEADTLLALILDEVATLGSQYPNIRSQALKVIIANIKDINKFNKNALEILGKGIELENFYDINLILTSRIK